MIRKAEKKDLEEIFTIIKYGKQKHQEERIIQWNDFYPTMEHISKDIEQNNMFVQINDVDDKIMGCICIAKESDGEYGLIPISDFYVLHRMSVHPDYYKKGVAKSLLNFSEKYALENNITTLIADTNIKNIMTNTLLSKQGFLRFDMKANVLKYLETQEKQKENEEWIEFGLTYNYYYKKLRGEENEL